VTPDREATRVPGTAAENPPFEPSIVPRDIGEATVAVAARRKDRLDALAQEIGGDTLVIEADITDREQAIATIEQTVGELGRLDTVVNNAGIMLLGDAEGAPLKEWDRMIAINVLGLLYVAHAAIGPLLKAAADSSRKVADMVNVSSIAGRRANRGSGVYNLTKHGVGAFSNTSSPAPRMAINEILVRPTEQEW